MSESVESSSNVDAASNADRDDGKPLGVRFAESSVGKPIIGVLLHIRRSIFLIVAAIGVVCVLIGAVLGSGTIAGMFGIWGVSFVLAGLAGYGGIKFVKRREAKKEPGRRNL